MSHRRKLEAVTVGEGALLEDDARVCAEKQDGGRARAIVCVKKVHKDGAETETPFVARKRVLGGGKFLVRETRLVAQHLKRGVEQRLCLCLCRFFAAFDLCCARLQDLLLVRRVLCARSSNL